MSGKIITYRAVRISGATSVCDLSGNILGTTIKEFFQKKLRKAEKFDSAIYEMKVASLYIREGHTVYFIDDKETQPEFLVKINDESVYVECKRIEKRPIQKAEGDTIRKLYNKVEEMLLTKNASVLVVCANSISNEKGWMEKIIQELIGRGGTNTAEQVGEYYFKVLPPSPKVSLPGYDVGLNALKFYEKYWVPFLDKQMEGCSVLGKNVVFEVFIEKLIPGMPHFQSYEFESYFGVAFKSLPAIILGIGKKIKKAASQLPAGGNGLVYVECPPFVATDEEINEFWRVVKKELNSTSRINALVITGTNIDTNSNSMNHFSNIVINKSSRSKLPNNFSILPLLDNFELN